MNHRHAVAAVSFAAFVAIVVSSCQTTKGGGTSDLGSILGAPALHNRLDEVMTSAFCGKCHSAIFAEHAQNTHGRAFTDEEVRLATGRFDHGDCIRCHTPRPVFETGIGMNPIRRFHGLEEGNTCMTCHWKPDYDYASFHGGVECKQAFDPRVGTVEACASCHRNHGTPYQWEIAPTGKAAGRDCITCHMKMETRPVADGQPAKPVRSHVFPGGRSEEHLRRAYAYDARIDGNEVVVRIENKGAGHNFPTELKQRSVESLVIVRDLDGNEVSRSRLVFRDPYKRPYGLQLPVNTQIPAGESREHRVPLKVSNGTVDCELHYKLYFPIEDHHPDLARRLEAKRLVFDQIEPSTKAVESEPEVKIVVPEGIDVRQASVADLVDFARPPIGTVEISVPSGDTPADIAKLIELFQFPVPEANVRARERLVKIGLPAVPALIEALGSWDNKTYNQAMKVLGYIGAPAKPALLAAMRSEQLYVRIHARQVVAKLAWGAQQAEVAAALRQDLTAKHPLDRAGSAEALGALGVTEAAFDLRSRLTDHDPDVVRAAALALVKLRDEGATAALETALRRAFYPETKRDLAYAAAALGSSAGVPALLDGLDYPDDLVRESFFESLFAVTGLHFGYDPLAPKPERLEAIARLRTYWDKSGGGKALLRIPPRHDPKVHAKAFAAVEAIGGGSGGVPAGDDAKLEQELVAMADGAVPALVLGLKFPAGFAEKRSLIIKILGGMRSREAAPAVAAALRDPVIGVAAWACWALEQIGDPATLTAVQRYTDRLLSLRAAGELPASAGPAEVLLAQAARTRLLLGDESARSDLVALLLAADPAARELAIGGLERKFGDRRGYDPKADVDERRSAARRWQ